MLYFNIILKIIYLIIKINYEHTLYPDDGFKLIYQINTTTAPPCTYKSITSYLIIN